MLWAASFHRPRLDALVEGHKPPAVRDRQREQVNVRHLLLPLQVIPVRECRIGNRNVVRPEGVIAAALGFI